MAPITEEEFRLRLSKQTKGSIALIGPYRGYTSHKTQFRCERQSCCHTWTIQPVRLTSAIKPTGCPACAPSGFDINKPAWLYLMGKPDEQQFGITNDLGGRIQFHERRGFLLLNVIGPGPGSNFLTKESELKLWLKEAIGLHIPGKTENWPTRKLFVESLAELFVRAKVSPPELSDEKPEMQVEFQEQLSEVPAQWKGLPRTKWDALESNSSVFFDGLRCRHGHLSPRFASGPCVECLRLSQLKILERKRADRRARIQTTNDSRVCPECKESFFVVPEMHIDKIYCSRKCAGAQSKRNYVASDPERRRKQSRSSARRRYHERKR